MKLYTYAWVIFSIGLITLYIYKNTPVIVLCLPFLLAGFALMVVSLFYKPKGKRHDPTRQSVRGNPYDDLRSNQSK